MISTNPFFLNLGEVSCLFSISIFVSGAMSEPWIMSYTLVTFLLYLGQKVSSWDLVEIIRHSLFIIINIDITSKSLRIWTKNTSKNTKKKFFFDWTGFEPGTLGLWNLHATKELRRRAVKDGDFFMVLNKTALKLLLFWRFLQYLLPNLDN